MIYWMFDWESLNYNSLKESLDEFTSEDVPGIFIVFCPNRWVEVHCGAYKFRTYSILTTVSQLLTAFAKNTGILIGEFYLPKSQRTSCWYKCTKMLPSSQLMLTFSGQILPETTLLNQHTLQTPWNASSWTKINLRVLYWSCYILSASWQFLTACLSHLCYYESLFCHIFSNFWFFFAFRNFWKFSEVQDFGIILYLPGFGKESIYKKSCQCSTHMVLWGGYPRG